MVMLMIRNLEAQGLASAAGDRGADAASREEVVGVRSLVEVASGSSVGSTTKVIAAGNSEATVSGVEGLVSAYEQLHQPIS